jgi:hypothetical protein
MEVHHPHHSTHKKKWGTYLLEFLMLFLAVFLGFVAENMREHVVERMRATKLASSLVTDLRRDTAELNRLTAFYKRQAERTDSLRSLLKMPFDEVRRQDFYRLVRQVQVSYAFVSANATTNQLKNAGYLRYFSKDSLSILLSEYEFILKDNEGMDQITTDLIYNKYYNFIIKVCDPDLLQLQFSDKRSVPDSMGIMPIAKEDLKQLQNLLVLMRRSTATFIENYMDLKKKAVEIMNYLEN